MRENKIELYQQIIYIYSNCNFKQESSYVCEMKVHIHDEDHNVEKK